MTRFDRVLFLSEREHEIFKLLGTGLVPKEIAQIPGNRCSVKTVYAYIARIRIKLKLEPLNRIICFAAVYNESGLTRVMVRPKQPRFAFKHTEVSFAKPSYRSSNQHRKTDAVEQPSQRVDQ